MAQDPPRSPDAPPPRGVDHLLRALLLGTGGAAGLVVILGIVVTLVEVVFMGGAVLLFLWYVVSFIAVVLIFLICLALGIDPAGLIP